MNYREKPVQALHSTARSPVFLGSFQEYPVLPRQTAYSGLKCNALMTRAAAHHSIAHHRRSHYTSDASTCGSAVRRRESRPKGRSHSEIFAMIRFTRNLHSAVLRAQYLVFFLVISATCSMKNYSLPNSRWRQNNFFHYIWLLRIQ
jgi:hypothetical protein